MDEQGTKCANSMDGQFEQNQSCSPTHEKIALPKSPVKRMRQLEEQQNKQDQEDVETAYRKSPQKALISADNV